MPPGERKRNGYGAQRLRGAVVTGRGGYGARRLWGAVVTGRGGCQIAWNLTVADVANCWFCDSDVGIRAVGIRAVGIRAVGIRACSSTTPGL
jgi:hypothetical protein